MMKAGAPPGKTEPVKADTCTICVEDFVGANSKSTVVLECKHVFHFKCIKEWQRAGHDECPNCRNHSDIVHFLKGRCPGKRDTGVSRVSLKHKKGSVRQPAPLPLDDAIPFITTAARIITQFEDQVPSLRQPTSVNAANILSALAFIQEYERMHRV